MAQEAQSSLIICILPSSPQCTHLTYTRLHTKTSQYYYPGMAMLKAERSLFPADVYLSSCQSRCLLERSALLAQAGGIVLALRRGEVLHRHVPPDDRRQGRLRLDPCSQSCPPAVEKSPHGCVDKL